ncbi:MAG: alpha/beta fold hydrolase [Acidimicrobiia bacterium]|nr:alpha/beta fold hydrolase [Acidimicrobiia bacterium]
MTTTTTLPPLEPPTYEALERIRVIRNFTGYTSRGLRRWQREVEAVEDVRITSTADGAEQPALWLPPRGDRPRPLLVVLHSWSAHYLQHAGIPYAMWAEDNGWAVIAPNYRGVNDDADSTGSDLAVQDAVDAIDWATAQDGVDADHVYTVGYSGGGMMSLLLAGRHPEKVAAAAAWGPPYDLVDFYRQARRQGRHYAWDLERACGGNPTSDADALASCVHRSPMAHLDAAREFSVPVFIGQGIWDTIVSPSQGARAFNQLADPEDRFSDEQVETFGRQRVPESISQPVAAESHFTDGDPGVVLARRSASVSLVYFRANHEMVYGASLRFFVDHLRNGQPPDPS